MGDDADFVDGALCRGEDFEFEVFVVDAPAFGRDGASAVEDVAADKKALSNNVI